MIDREDYDYIEKGKSSGVLGCVIVMCMVPLALYILKYVGVIGG